jgi:uncharacterized protein YycO
MKRTLLLCLAALLFLALIGAGLKLAGRIELQDLQSLRQPSVLVQVLAAAGRGEFGIGDYDNIPNNLDLSDLQPGDILLAGNPGGSYGRFTHAGFYIGDGQVIDMYTSDGVYVTGVEIYHSYTWAAILRVKTSPEIRAAAVNFAKQQVGAPFFILAPKYDDGLWYCSKLAWYAYYQSGVDLDPLHNSYWILPDDLLLSPKTSLVAFAGTMP